MEEHEGLTYLDLAELVDGPFVVTFTAHLPFPIGIPNNLGHSIIYDTPFKDAEATAHFGPKTSVRIRVFDYPESGLPMWQKGTHAAIENLYGVRLPEHPEERYGEEAFMEHNQWVTLETPYSAMETEDPDRDPAFTFHRCLNTFNIFLQASLLLTKDVRIRQISSRDLRPAVIIGSLQNGKEWQMLSVMYMHPDAQPEGLLAVDKPFTQGELNDALYAITTNRPYVTTMIWRSRAQRSLKQTGDAADAVISFQIAAESLLFDTYRMLLVDEGCSSVDIASHLKPEIPFKSLVTRKLPARLGGDWDVTRAGTAVGDYWKKLYNVRNSIVHGGLQAHGGHADEAQTVYWGLRDHLEARLWANCKKYPRTVLVRVGEDHLSERGWLTMAMRDFIEKTKNEPKPFYWPYDIAGREP